MKIAASDKGTGKSESITIRNDKGRLSDEEIERVVAEAEEFAAEDEAIRKMGAMNSLSNFGLIPSALLEDFEEKLVDVQVIINPITSKLYEVLLLHSLQCHY